MNIRQGLQFTSDVCYWSYLWNNISRKIALISLLDIERLEVYIMKKQALSGFPPENQISSTFQDCFSIPGLCRVGSNVPCFQSHSKGHISIFNNIKYAPSSTFSLQWCTVCSSDPHLKQIFVSSSSALRTGHSLNLCPGCRQWKQGCNEEVRQTLTLPNWQKSARLQWKKMSKVRNLFIISILNFVGLLPSCPCISVNTKFYLVGISWDQNISSWVQYFLGPKFFFMGI